MSEEHGESGGQAKQAGQDAPHPPQLHPAVSAEELQLAAQLTQGLAARGFSPVGAERREDVASSAEQFGPDEAQQRLADRLREHLGEEAAHAQAQPQHGASAATQGIVPTEDHERENEAQATHLQYYSLGAFPGAVQSMHPEPAQFAAADLPPRKRTKVSRACDECRRKKIKCDAASESGEEPCSNCKRSMAHCLFSRVPQKRGPSKGYIKELADRIHHIEGKLGTQGLENIDLGTLVRRESSGAYSDAVSQDEISRKRPYSSISGEALPTPMSNRHAAWATETRPAPPIRQSTSDRRYSSNGLAPRPIALSSDEAEALSSQYLKEVEGTALANPLGQPSSTISKATFEAYLAAIHHTFPILPSNSDHLEVALQHAPEYLRIAFMEAMNAAVSSLQQRSSPTLGDSRNAIRWLAAWDADETPRSMQLHLLYLQTLILLLIETDNHGPSSLRGQHGGPAKSSLLGRAVGYAYAMGLHVTEAPARQASGSEEGSLILIGSRCWWALVTLDRWSAISTATPTMIPNDSVIVRPRLLADLGSDAYFLLRLSNILGHLTPVALSLTNASRGGPTPILGSWINLAVEELRLQLPDSITTDARPVVHLAYWHVRLLAYLLSPASFAKDFLWACTQSTELLLANANLSSPLNHHFTCLTGLCAAELSRSSKARDEGLSLVKSLMGSPIPPSAWDAAIRDKIDERVRQAVEIGSETSAADTGLQHLADLAAAKGSGSGGDASTAISDDFTLRKGDNYEDAGFDPRPMLRHGYLNIIAPLDTAME